MSAPADLRSVLVAAGLVASLPAPEAPASGGDVVARWARSGGMALTGQAAGPPLLPPADVLGAVDDALAVFRSAAAGGGGLGTAGSVGSAEALLFGRAGLLGHRRAGRMSSGGTCRLLPASDGWLTLNLARPSDVELVPALLGGEPVVDPWVALAERAAARPAADLVDAARELGVPAAVVPSGAGAGAAVVPSGTGRGAGPATAVTVVELGPGRGGPSGRPLVVDLSALWAGPLATRLLGLAGARVVKVESTGRPDGARAGHPRFAAWLHDGHESVALDFGAAAGRDALASLVRRADLVVEASRPRALRHLGIERDAVVREGGGTWLAITGYGSDPGRAGWTAFGDDAAAAAGLVGRDDDGAPVFCGDALADPLTGIWAAAAASAALAAGGGRRIEVTLAGVSAEVAARPLAPVACDVVADGAGGWRVDFDGGSAPVRSPAPLTVDPSASMPSLGRHTEPVLAKLGSALGR